MLEYNDKPCSVLRIGSAEEAYGYDHNFYEKLPSVGVCSYEEIEKLKSEKIILPLSIKEGDTLILSPFENEYFLIEDCENKIYERKREYIARIAQLLGATEYTNTLELISMQEREWDFKAGMQIKAVDTSLKIHKEESERLKQRFEKHLKFAIQNPDWLDKVKQLFHKNREYEEALQLAESHNLLSIGDVRELLSMRHPERFQPLTEYEIKYEMSAETESRLNVAFGLKALPIKLDINFEKATKFEKRVNATMKIIF